MKILSCFVLAVCLHVPTRAAETLIAQPDIAHLVAFARLYGYVRFFHPSDEASRVDWDRFAVHGAHRVAELWERTELRSTLEELFLPVAPKAKSQPHSRSQTPRARCTSPGNTKELVSTTNLLRTRVFVSTGATIRWS